MSDAIRHLVYVGVHNKNHELQQILLGALFPVEGKYGENVWPLRLSMARYNYDNLQSKVYACMEDLTYNAKDFLGTYRTS